MKTARRPLTALAAASALLAALALPALAQPGSANCTGAGPGGGAGAGNAHCTGAGPGAGPGAQGRQFSAEKFQQRRAQHQAQLKQKLQLTPAQEAAWSTYTQATQEMPAKGMRADRRALHDEMAKLTTPERIDRMQALRSEHIAQSNRRADATRAFYAQLTPAQQKVFDAETLHMHGDGPKGRGGPGGGMRRGGGGSGGAAMPQPQ